MSGCVQVSAYHITSQYGKFDISASFYWIFIKKLHHWKLELRLVLENARFVLHDGTLILLQCRKDCNNSSQINLHPFHYFFGSGVSKNILQRNLFIIFESSKMIAQLWLCSIFFLTIIVPMRWLAANTFKFCHCNWGEKSMGRVIDLIYNAFVAIHTWLQFYDGHLCRTAKWVALF